MALKSDVLTQKNFKSHLLKARLNSICMKYLLLPPVVHELMLTLGGWFWHFTAIVMSRCKEKNCTFLPPKQSKLRFTL